MAQLVASRRGFIAGAAALIAAPAVVSASSLMQLSGEPLYVGGNNLLTIDMITREAVRLFTSSNIFLQNLEAQYSDEFGRDDARIGSTLRIRLPNNYVVGEKLSYDKMWRTVVRRPVTFDEFYKNESTFEFKGLETQLPAPLAIAGGVALAASKNPVVSRRFWARG